MRQAFEARMAEMPPSTFKAADWLARNTAAVAWNRVEDIAKQIGVSPATVVRAVKLSGYDGYAQLQKVVREQLPRSSAWQTSEDATHAGEPQPVKAIVASVKHDVDRLEAAVTPVLGTLVDVLVRARRTVVAASLMSVPLAEYMALHLRLLLGHVDHVDASSSRAGLDYRDLGSDDAVIGVSFPRYAKSTRDFLTRALKRTGNVVLITDEDGPTLRDVHCVVRIPARKMYRYSSSIGYMTLIQILAASVAERSPKRVLENLDAADAIWKDLDVLQRAPSQLTR